MEAGLPPNFRRDAFKGTTADNVRYRLFRHPSGLGVRRSATRSDMTYTRPASGRGYFTVSVIAVRAIVSVAATGVTPGGCATGFSSTSIDRVVIARVRCWL